MAELSASEKLSHASVAYEQPSRHKPEHCGNCKHFIPPNRCEHVQSPIRSADWCRKWEQK